MTTPGLGTEIRIPFMHGKTVDIGWWYVPLVFIGVLATDNGVNFTDGLDGLCSSVTMLVAVFFTVVAIGEHSGLEPITAAVVGSLLGFLLFNVYPARVFMGCLLYTSPNSFMCMKFTLTVTSTPSATKHHIPAA